MHSSYFEWRSVVNQAPCSQSFSDQDQDQAQVYKYFTIDFFRGDSKLFYERKGKFYSCDRYEMLSPLNNRINFIIVKCVHYILKYYAFRSKQHLPFQSIHQSSFLEQIMGNSPEINYFETWAWSWSWTWKSLWTRGQVYVHLHYLL